MALPGPKNKATPKVGSTIEPLESRIAPATFINVHTIKYTDIDGDLVTIHSSNPLFDPVAKGINSTNNSILKFSTGSVDNTSTPQQLQELFLGNNVNAKIVTGDSISITVQKVAGGDGFANVGVIDSTFSLRHISVQGDLGAIDAGGSPSLGNSSVGLVSLNVHSLGAQGSSTLPPGGSLISAIKGNVGSITVQKDMVDAQIGVTSNSATSKANGSIGSIYRRVIDRGQ